MFGGHVLFMKSKALKNIRIVFRREVDLYPMNKNESAHIYSGDIVAGSLMIRESRIIARMLLNGAEKKTWRQAIVVDNVLQKKSPKTAYRQARLIKNRLAMNHPDLWRLVDGGAPDTTAQALLVAAIKHSRLLGDFMDNVIRENWQTFKKKITLEDWRDFIETCAQIDPNIRNWSETTRAKIRQNVFRILAEAKYLDNTRSRNLQPVMVAPEVRQYLTDHNENRILRRLEVTS